MPEQKEMAFEFEDPENTIPVEMRWAAVLAAESVLREHGVTLEECVRVGANAYAEYPVGEVVSLYDFDNRIADAWLDAHDAAWDATGTPADTDPTWRLRITWKPVQLLN